MGLAPSALVNAVLTVLAVSWWWKAWNLAPIAEAACWMPDPIDVQTSAAHQV